MNAIAFTVLGIPKGQPRPRAFARRMGDKFVARVYDCGSAEGWKGDIAIAAKEHMPAVPLEGPIRLEVDFLFPRPQNLMRRKDPEGEIPHTSKPDADNALKAVCDCLTILGFWRDDAQVYDARVRKLYVAKNAQPGARVTITPMRVEAPLLCEVGA